MGFFKNDIYTFRYFCFQFNYNFDGKCVIINWLFVNRTATIKATTIFFLQKICTSILHVYQLYNHYIYKNTRIWTLYNRFFLLCFLSKLLLIYLWILFKKQLFSFFFVVIAVPIKVQLNIFVIQSAKKSSFLMYTHSHTWHKAHKNLYSQRGKLKFAQSSPKNETFYTKQF